MWKLLAVFLDLGEHRGKDLKAQILFIAQTIGTALKDANLVVETLDKAEGDFVLGAAVSGDAVPVMIDHRSELLVGLGTNNLGCSRRRSWKALRALGIRHILARSRQSAAAPARRCFEPLPFKRRLPVLKKAPRPSLVPVVPQLPEGFLEQIGDVEPVVGWQQFVKGTAAVQREIVAVRQQGVTSGP